MKVGTVAKVTFIQVTLSSLTRGHPGFLSPQIFLDLLTPRQGEGAGRCLDIWLGHHAPHLFCLNTKPSV